MNKLNLVKSSGNVFKDVNIDEFEARELQFRSTIMTKLNLFIQEKKLTQVEAAEIFGVSQSRISNLKSGRIDLFSTGMLMAMLEKSGVHIFEHIEEWLEAA